MTLIIQCVFFGVFESLLSLCVAVVGSFLLLYNIQLYNYNIQLVIHFTDDEYLVVSRLGLLGIVLL